MMGEMIQLATMVPMVVQSTTPNPAALTAAPTTPPTTEWVVDTGAPKKVARLSHSAAANRADIMDHTNIMGVWNWSDDAMPLEMVWTTSPPAMMAPDASHRAAMTRAPLMVSARAPTAGPTLLATSLAPMFM